MNKKLLTEQINKALKDLGYRDGSKVRVKSIGIDRYEVYVDDKSIGIWDSARKTFVD